MSEVITFKVDGELREALKNVRNRSEFIRSALMAALDGTCPLCRGTGTLTPHQMEHWMTFSRGHEVRECGDCHGLVIECTENCQSTSGCGSTHDKSGNEELKP